MTTIVSLVHASYILREGGIPEVIAALVEDCMSLTVANVPVVATASFRRFFGTRSLDETEDHDGQRWSALKFHTWTTRPPGATTYRSTGFNPELTRGEVSVSNTTELTSTTLNSTRKSKPVYSVGTLGPNETFVGAKTDGEQDVNAKTGKDEGVVHMDVLPFPRQPSSS
jgi:hypothetical protein